MSTAFVPSFGSQCSTLSSLPSSASSQLSSYSPPRTRGSSRTSSRPTSTWTSSASCSPQYGAPESTGIRLKEDHGTSTLWTGSSSRPPWSNRRTRRRSPSTCQVIAGRLLRAKVLTRVWCSSRRECSVNKYPGPRLICNLRFYSIRVRSVCSLYFPRSSEPQQDHMKMLNGICNLADRRLLKARVIFITYERNSNILMDMGCK